MPEHAMLLQAFFSIDRKRFLGAAIAALVFVLFAHMLVSAETLTDFGIFWHHVCACPPDPGDAATLLRSLNLIAVFIGGICGANAVPRNAGAQTILDTRRFLLTRPVSRIGVQLYPLFFASLAIAILPLAAWAVLVGWLYLVHAPSLAHLLALMELVPSASHLGPHPSLPALAHAIHFGRLYLGSVCVGLLSYTGFNACRWFLVGPLAWLRMAAAFWWLLLWGGFILPHSWNYMPAILLIAPHNANIAYTPSNLGIALHFAACLAFLVAAHRTVRKAEL